MTKNNLAIISETFRTKESVGKLALALCGAADEAGKERAYGFIASVLMEVERTAGDEKKDLTRCTPQSIFQSAVDAAKYGLAIDGRQHAHLIAYKDKCQLQIGYRGFLAKLKEFYPDMTPTLEFVSEGDTFSLSDNSGYQTYLHVKADPFANDQNKMKGVFCHLSWTDGDEKYSKVTVLPKSEVDKIRKAAKQDFVWSAWYLEKAKVAAVRRACKFHFAGVQGIQKLVEHDNQEFDLNEPESLADTSAVQGRIASLSGKLNMQAGGLNFANPETMEMLTQKEAEKHVKEVARSAE